MKAIAIPGKVPATQQWIAGVAHALHVPALDLQVHRFAAWQQPQAAFDLQAELAHMPHGQCDLLLAKSIGTLACVLTPALQALTARQRVLIIQQEADPFGSYEALAQLVGETAQCRCVAGNDHLYSDIDELGRIIRAWLQ